MKIIIIVFVSFFVFGCGKDDSKPNPNGSTQPSSSNKIERVGSRCLLNSEVYRYHKKSRDNGFQRSDFYSERNENGKFPKVYFSSDEDMKSIRRSVCGISEGPLVVIALTSHDVGSMPPEVGNFEELIVSWGCYGPCDRIRPEQ